MSRATIAQRIVDVCRDAAKRAVALSAIPRMSRQPGGVPTGLLEREYIDFLRVLASRFGDDGVDVALQIGAMLAHVRVHRGVLRDLLVDWPEADLRAFAQLADAQRGLGDEAAEFVAGLFDNGMTQFPNLRRHVDAFRAPDRPTLEAFREQFNRVVQWDASNYRVNTEAGVERFTDAAQFGRRLEDRARQVLGGADELVNVDALPTNRLRGVDWNYSGRNYAIAKNFPFIDFVHRQAGAPPGPASVLSFGQIASGNLQYLRGKFFKLTGQEGRVELIAESVEELQFLGFLPRAIQGRTQTTPELCGVFFDGFLPRAKLWVPAPAVEVLRADVAGRLSFSALAGQFSRESGLVADRFLDVIQPLPASVYS